MKYNDLFWGSLRVISQRTVALSIAVGSLDEVDDGFAVTHIALEVNATIADISNEQCQTVCEQTKKAALFQNY